MKVLVTGGTNGMGKGVANILAGRDPQAHEIIILGRSKELGEATVKEIESITNNKNISFVLCDLSKLKEVRNIIKEIRSQHEFLDSIFINAGLGYAAKQVDTEDGLDPHFQVNYLSHFMLTLNLLDLLEKSVSGGRVIFNATEGGEIFWDDLQLKQNWGYEKAIRQAMVAKRIFYAHLHHLYRQRQDAKLSFYGFHIPKAVWSNQINIIPVVMKMMAKIMKSFGQFYSMEECGKIMAPLFTETQVESLKKSGNLISWRKGKFIEIENGHAAFDQGLQEKLWKISLDLCHDEKTVQIAEKLENF